MRIPRIVIVFVVAALALPAWGAAQGLGDAAARERAKRTAPPAAKKPEPAKSFTNDDLDKGRPPETATSGSEGTQVPEEVPAPQPSDPGENRSELERPYMDAVMSAQSRVTQLEAKVRELQDKLNPMSGNYVHAGAGSMNPFAEIQLRDELTQAEPQLQAARQELATANQALADFRQGRTTPPPD